MLLKYIVPEDDKGIEISYYDSSNILKSYYNFNNESLRLVFGSGKVYTYDHVTESEYMDFKLNESQGKFFNSNFRTKNFALTSNESGGLIKEELELIYTNEKNNFLELVKLKMKDFITHTEFNKEKALDIINTLKYLM